MKEIKMDFEEFKQLHETINEQEKVIKQFVEAQAQNKGFVVSWREKRVPRYDLGHEHRYDRFQERIHIPDLSDYDEGVEAIARTVKSIKKRIDELYMKGERVMMDRALKKARKELEPVIRAEMELKYSKKQKKVRKKWWS